MAALPALFSNGSQALHRPRARTCLIGVLPSAPLKSKQNKHAFGSRYGLHKELVHVPGPARLASRRRIVAHSGEELGYLGLDFLKFLGATVLVIPVFKKYKLSPVLGFLFSGFVLQQSGLIHERSGIEELSELGVLFLLFEMGLELSIDRLKALAKYAFGMGSLQVLLSTLFFTAMAMPAGRGLATDILEILAKAPPSLVSIRSLDEAVVIGVALSMSSSAFVLQLLSERGEMATRFGSATLGILLFQDIAAVPFLVLLPVTKMIEADPNSMSLLEKLGPTALTTMASLAALLVGGRVILRRIFEIVAASRSSEAFVAMSLLTVCGISLLTKELGFSDTLGAFLAGVLVSETSFRTQIEATITPFRGLLLGLFFVSTGASINTDVLIAQWPSVIFILGGLLVVKTAVISLLGERFGLTRAESVRTGFLLSQGGEFAFLLLSLANNLSILPTELNELLIIVVVLSMALTPALAECGKLVSEVIEKMEEPNGKAALVSSSSYSHLMEDPVVIIGFGIKGQMLGNMLNNALASDNGHPVRYVAFDLNPTRVEAARRAGFPAIFGEGSSPEVLRAAGVKKPRAVVVNYNKRERAIKAVTAVRVTFPTVPILAAAVDFRHAAELKAAGADSVTLPSANAALAMGCELLMQLGTSVDDVQFVRKGLEDALSVRCDDMVQGLNEEEKLLETVLVVSRSIERLAGGKEDPAALPSGTTPLLLTDSSTLDTTTTTTSSSPDHQLDPQQQQQQQQQHLSAVSKPPNEAPHALSATSSSNGASGSSLASADELSAQSPSSETRVEGSVRDYDMMSTADEVLEDNRDEDSFAMINLITAGQRTL